MIQVEPSRDERSLRGELLFRGEVPTAGELCQHCLTTSFFRNWPDVREVPNNARTTHILRGGREIWMFPRLSAHDAPLQMSGLSIEAFSMDSWTEPTRTSGLLPLR